MRYRRLGKTGFEVSTIGFGAWAIGGSWGQVDDAESMRALHAAVDAGVTFIDTADVYGDGRSERLVARLQAERDERLVVATKLGRRVPVEMDNYSPQAFRGWVERSREYLQTETLDLVQLHTLPPAVYDRDDLFDTLDELVAEGAIASYGASVETTAEGLAAIRRPNLGAVQIIFNAFRQKPLDEFLAAAAAADVGVIARVPLASGLLTGKFDPSSTFAPDDHRNYNRHGEKFDVGETFSGVDYDTGVRAAEELRPLVPPGATMAQLALRWILMEDAVSTTIPGARTADQARANAAAADLDPLDDRVMRRIREVYDADIRQLVHDRW